MRASSSSRSLLRALGLALAVATSACDGDSDEGSDGAPPPPQAPPGEPPVGQTPPATPATGLKVTVVAAGAPLADVRVFFHDASGAVTGDQKTNAAGIVEAEAAPAQVTVLASEPQAGGGTRTDVITYTEVRDGDRLVLDLTSAGGVAALPRYDVSLPGDFGGAESYALAVDRTCVSEASSAIATAVDLGPACTRSTNAILARAASGGEAIAYATKKGVATPAGAASAPLTLDAWTPPTTTTISATNTPPGDSAIIQAVAIADQTSFSIPSRVGAGTTDAEQFPMPPGAFAGSHQGAVIETFTAGSDFGGRAVVKRQAASTTMSIDFAQALPKMTSASLDLANKARPGVAWTSERPFASADVADLGLVRIRWTHSESDRFTWTLVVPPTAQNVTAPALPSDAITIGAVPADAIVIDSIAFFDASGVTARDQIVSLPVHPRFGGITDIGFPLPSDGTTLRVTGWKRSFTMFTLS